MPNDEKTEIFQAILIIGGVVLAGKIIKNLTEPSDNETPRESHYEEKPKDNNNKSRRFIVEVPMTNPNKKLPSGNSASGLSEERKYPPNYYQLTKIEKLKYRQRLAKDLIQISSPKKL